MKSEIRNLRFEISDLRLRTITSNDALRVVARYEPQTGGYDFKYGVKGDGRETGNETIDTYFPGSIFKKNVIVGGRSVTYPPDNFFPPAFDQVIFVNRTGGNYGLASASPYKNAGTDGEDIGCDLDALNAAINGTATITRESAGRLVGQTANAGLLHGSTH